MFNKIKCYINEKKSRQNIYMLIVASFLTIVTLLLYAIPSIRNVAQIKAKIPVSLQLASYTTILAYIIFCFVCRFKQYGNTLRAIFFYQLPAIIFFIIEMALTLANHPSSGGFFMHGFNAWTLLARPFSHLITPFVGMSEIYTKLLVYIIIVIISATCFTGMKKDIAFKEKIEEKHRFEQNNH